MRLNKNRFLAFLITGISFLCTNFAFAAQAGNPGGMTGDGCDDRDKNDNVIHYGHTGGDCSVVWFEYTYNENATSEHPETWIPAASNAGTTWGDAGHIGATSESGDDSCRSEAGKFYSKGVAMADRLNHSAGDTYIFYGSQQFGVAPPDFISRDHYIISNPNPSIHKSFAYSASFTIGGSSTSITTPANEYGDNITPPDSSTVRVASGNIVSTSTAHEAFCRAAGVDDISACMSNNETVLNTKNGSFTFEGSSNPASWFCAVDNTKKEEELDSTSNVTIRTSAHSSYVYATAYDNQAINNSPSGYTNAGSYEYQTSSTVYSADGSVLNKIAFSDAMCRSAGGLVSFGGSPAVSDSNIFGSPSGGDNSTKCSTYNPSSSAFTSFMLFPGQSKAFSASVTHPSKIVKSRDTVSRTSDATNETSNASITLTAAPIKCWNDERYKIGNGNFTNYYRLGLKKNDSAFDYTKVYPYVYEKDKKGVSIWAKPDDKIQFNYDLCSGGALKDDIDGVANDTIKAKNYYTVNANSNFSDKAWIWNASDARVTSLGIAGSNFGDTPAARINNSYAYSTNSPKNESYKIENGSELIGSVISNTLGETSATVKIPYNYILEPEIGDETASSLMVGNTYSFYANVASKGRENVQTRALPESKATNIKEGTNSFAAIFAISDGTTLSDLQSKLAEFSNRIGKTNEYYYNNSSESPLTKLGGLIDHSVALSEKGNIIDHKVELKYTVKDNERVGTKICSIVAVYPADSHNSIASKIDTDDQDVALSHSFGENPYWRFRINCATVGKYPTMSVEGGSLVASGEVETSTTSYNHRIFGSWAEYDLVASAAKKAGSGASLAYATPQSTPNSNGDYTTDGINDTGELRVPQTLGNTASPDYGIGSDAENALQLSKKFAENIKGYCYDEIGNASGNCSVLPEGTTSIDNSYSGLVLYKANSNSSFTIPSNIYNNSENAVIVIYGKNIKISNAATQIDAMIIAEDGLDTCDEGDKDAKTGNQALLEKCDNDLIINGAVYSKGKISDTENHLLLDRSKGGGSFDGEMLSPNSLSQRAEIFSFDPRIVKVSQDIHESLDVTEIQYIKEIAPRY